MDNKKSTSKKDRKTTGVEVGANNLLIIPDLNPDYNGDDIDDNKSDMKSRRSCNKSARSRNRRKKKKSNFLWKC